MPPRSPLAPASQARPTPIADVYWRFAAARQALFFARLEGQPAPWTTDPILANHRFTNAYRASDRVSQFLIRHVIYDPRFQAPEDIVFRVLLFKFFNRIDTWQRLEQALGPLAWSEFQPRRAEAVLAQELAAGRTKIKQHYRPGKAQPLPAPWYPPKWGSTRASPATPPDRPDRPCPANRRPDQERGSGPGP